MSGSFKNGGEGDPGRVRFRETEDIVDELNLRQGELIHAYVERVLSGEDQRLLLNLKGSDVVAASRPDVQQGDSLIVRVTSVSHPVKLEIFTPEEAGENLTEPQLSDLVSTLGLQPTEKLSELAGAMLEAGIPLEGDLLSEAGRHLGDLTDQDGELVSERLRAFQFLYSREEQVTPGLLENLAGIPADSGGIDWSPALVGMEPEQPDNSFDLRFLLSRLGVDLVARIGRRPHTASRSLHANLLKKRAEKRALPEEKKLLSTLLALALTNLEKPEKFNLQLPLAGKNGLEHLRLLVKIGSTPEGWKEPNWLARIRKTESDAGVVGVEIKKTKSKLKFTFRCADETRANQLRVRLEEFEEIFTGVGYDVTTEVINETPGELPDPLAASGAGEGEGLAGGVNLQV